MKKIVAGIFLAITIASGVWVISSKNTDAAIWSDSGATYFSQDATYTSCSIGHCSVLPATETPYCADGYSGSPCTQSYSPYVKNDSSRISTAKYTCSNGNTPTQYNSSWWCSVYSYSAELTYGGWTIADARTNCTSTRGGEFRQSPQAKCYYTKATYGCSSGLRLSNGYCYRDSTLYSCDNVTFSTTPIAPNGCSRTDTTKYAYRSNAGDANYKIWGIIRSGDTDNASMNQSQFFKGSSSGKPAALVQVLKDYYYGTHTNIDKIGNAAYAKTGAAFVVNTMLGRPQGSSRDISSRDFDTLTSVLQYLDGKRLIDWNASINGDKTNKNTHMVKVKDAYDITQTNDDVSNRSGMTIKDGSGKIIYSLMYACANPYGDMEGIAPFDLYPSLTISPEGVVEQGAVVTLNPSVDNRDKGSSYQTDWILSRMVLKGGATPKQGSNGTPQTPSQYFSGSVQLQSGKQNFVQGWNTLPSFSSDLPPVVPGDLICYALSVSPYGTTGSGWRHSTPRCVKIGKQPKMQVWGGDVRAGRAMSGVTASLGLANIVTSTSAKSDSTFGSWVEYGASATGTISGFGSGSAFAPSGGMQNANTCSWSVLSFVNTEKRAAGCSINSKIGSYTDNRMIPDIASSFGVQSSTPSVSGTVNVSSLAGVNKALTDIIISGGTIAKGRWAVIYAPNNNVTISGDIRYVNGPFKVLEDIPQLVIIAKNIAIDSSVTQVDSWLIAKARNNGTEGTINTCREKGLIGSLSINDCTKLLTVNGPVMANKLYLRRTGGSGSGPTSGDPAERFNLRPDAYMWAYTRANSTQRANTVYVQELPPRL